VASAARPGADFMVIVQPPVTVDTEQLHRYRAPPGGTPGAGPGGTPHATGIVMRVAERLRRLLSGWIGFALFLGVPAATLIYGHLIGKCGCGG
jgi:hypothetical protein